MISQDDLEFANGTDCKEPPSLLIPIIVAGIYFLALMFTSNHYGYFRDALYYLACSEHLAWDYVDHPPLIVLIAWIGRHTLGTSLPALMFLPALAGAGHIVLTAAFAQELGTKTLGTAFAAVLVATPGVWYVIDHEFAMNALEPLFWTGCAFVILRMINTGDPKLWLAFGAIAGLGLENKYSIAVFAFALLLGLLLTSQRKFLFTPWLIAGGALALLIFLPKLIWNIQHHWPFLELMRNIRASGRDIALSPLQFVLEQILITGPNSIYWIIGLLFYFFSRTAKAYCLFGWAFVLTIAFFMLAHGKNYYSVPVYTIVFAGGALAVETFFPARGLLRDLDGARLCRLQWWCWPFSRFFPSCQRCCRFCRWMSICAIRSIFHTPCRTPSMGRLARYCLRIMPINLDGRNWSRPRH